MLTCYMDQGFQVAPAELEAHLLSHDFVYDCTIIAVPDDRSGEAPKAFIVKSDEAKKSGKSDEDIAKDIAKYVSDHKARHKWLTGGIEYVDAIPKSPSGKILRRVLRDMDREKRRKEGAKM